MFKKPEKHKNLTVEIMKVVNIVATIDLNVPVNIEMLKSYMEALHTAVYEPSRFPGLIIKLDSGVSFLVFRTGKIVIAGCKSVRDVESSAKLIVKYVVKVVPELPTKVVIRIQNLVFTDNIGVKIDLETLAERLKNEAIYDPESFPGLIYKPGPNKPTALIFSTGRVVIVGASSEEEAREMVERIRTLATQYSISYQNTVSQ